MKKQPQLKRIFTNIAMIGLVSGLLSCGGSKHDASLASNSPATSYLATSLVVDNAATPGYGAGKSPQIDANLVNAWGLAFNPTGFVWVANNATATSTLYDGNGVVQSLVVTLPAGQAGSASPTGIVFNASSDFKATQAGLSGSSAFLFAGEAGTISGWSPSVDRTHAVTMVDNGASAAVYKGLATASFGGANFLYATDFHNNRVDVFDATFSKATLPGKFTDPTLPAGYAPFGIQAIGANIYITYALQSAAAHDEVHGAGLGIVDLFDSGGNFIKHLVAVGGALNAPWGVAIAPAGFGAFSGDLLLANFGDGKINVFDPVTGSMVGTLSQANGQAIIIDGLWGIAFGNGVNNQPITTLFFTAGPGDEAHGAYGRIDAQ